MRALFWILLTACAAEPIGDGDGVVDADETPEPGWEAPLTGRFHDVAGTAVIVDDRTIELRDFTYDGGGLNARVFVLPAGADIDQAYETDSGNLVGSPFDNGVLTLTLPDEATLADFNALTLWCIPAAVSFGDGVFTPPG